MGYDTKIIEVELFIPAGKITPAFEALKQFLSDKKDDYHLSYLHDEIQQSRDIVHFFHEINYDSEIHEGDFFILSFDGRLSSQESLFTVLAPYVEPGSYILWQGEEDFDWGYFFDGNTMVEMTCDQTLNQSFRLRETIKLNKSLNEELPLNSDIARPKV